MEEESEKKPSIAELHPCNKEEQEAKKKQGSILGWIVLKPGHPTQTSHAASLPAKANTNPKKNKAAATPPREVNPLKPRMKKQKKHGSYVDWTSAENIRVLDNFVEAKQAGDEPVLPLDGQPFPSCQTVNSWVAKLKQYESDNGLLEHVTVSEFTEKAPKADKHLIITVEQCGHLCNAIKARDFGNKGMDCKEVVDLIAQLGQVSLKSADNHFCWLVREKKLPDLKCNGKVVKAQKTTTSRSQVHMEQQLCWHSLIDFMNEKVTELNQPAEEFAKVHAHFIGNIDETGVMANSGSVHVIGCSLRKKIEKNMDDCRDSITIVRSGTASGEQDPLIFLAAGEMMDKTILKDLEALGCPKGSTIIMTPSAYMTDETWFKVVPHLCKGLRALPVVCDHPDWCVVHVHYIGWLFFTFARCSSCNFYGISNLGCTGRW